MSPQQSQKVSFQEHHLFHVNGEWAVA